jgi:hypothetical protein
MLYEIALCGFLVVVACLAPLLVFEARETIRDSAQVKAGLAAVRGESMVLWASVWVLIGVSVALAAAFVAVSIASAVAAIAYIGWLL